MNEGCRGKSRAPHAGQRRPPARRRRSATLHPRPAFPIAELLAQLPFLRAIRGRMGDIVFKTYGRKIIITRVPDFSSYVPSPAQRARRDRMRAATAYAQQIYAHPAAKAFYVAAAKKLHRQPFRLAVSDYLTAHPRVTQVASLCTLSLPAERGVCDLALAICRRRAGATGIPVVFTHPTSPSRLSTASGLPAAPHVPRSCRTRNYRRRSR